MKNKTTRLEEGLKVMAGRHLTASQMSGAMPGPVRGIGCSKEPFSIDELRKKEDGGYIHFRQSSRFQTTRDVSHSEITHSNYYPEKTVVLEYDSEGRLERKNSHMGGSFIAVSGSKTREYDPAGSWFGKRI